MQRHLVCPTAERAGGFDKLRATGDPKRILNALRQKHPGNPLSEDDARILRRLKIPENAWSDVGFHLRHRVTQLADIFAIFPGLDASGFLRDDQRYRASVPPLVIAQGEPTVLLNHLPPKDYFDHDNTDPYGIFSEKSAIRNQRGEIIASQKFPGILLVNLERMFCPHGCAGCYKTEMTREFGSSLTPDNPVRHMEDLAAYLGAHPDINTVILSGGEPLMLSNEILERMLYELRLADGLRIVRICTGTVFMGMPFRIDDGILGILREFEKSTGKRVLFHLHLLNHHQFTPEAIAAVVKIRQAGFQMNSQVPIKEGMNFFREDLEKTKVFWARMNELQVYHGVNPYKYILDMHPRTIAHLPPLELALVAWSYIANSHEFGELNRPKTFSILCREGNIVLEGNMLKAMQKEVIKEKGAVRYHLTATYRISSEGSIESGKQFTYEEPLWPGINDGP